MPGKSRPLLVVIFKMAPLLSTSMVSVPGISVSLIMISVGIIMKVSFSYKIQFFATLPKAIAEWMHANAIRTRITFKSNNLQAIFLKLPNQLLNFAMQVEQLLYFEWDQCGAFPFLYEIFTALKTSQVSAFSICKTQSKHKSRQKVHVPHDNIYFVYINI